MTIQYKDTAKAFSGNVTVENKIYLMMNKPYGYVCKAEADRHRTVFELLPKELQLTVKGAKRGERLHTVGRLDLNTSGLLLITNDGQFSHKLTVPENHVQKVYEVQLVKEVSESDQKKYIQLASEGLTLPPDKKAPEEQSAPAKIRFTSETTCLITVTEGKFHEVRRIFVTLGNEVLHLKRIKMGPFSLPQNLPEGKFIELSKDELFIN